MKTVMLVGRTQCGKTTFCRRLLGLGGEAPKTQAIEILATAVDTPGEYLENPRFYRALLVSSVEAETILFMQDCTEPASIFPPAFAAMFPGKTVYGVVSKIDLGTAEQAATAEDRLRQAGATRVFRASGRTGEGMAGIRTALASTGRGV